MRNSLLWEATGVATSLLAPIPALMIGPLPTLACPCHFFFAWLVSTPSLICGVSLLSSFETLSLSEQGLSYHELPGAPPRVSSLPRLFGTCTCMYGYSQARTFICLRVVWVENEREVSLCGTVFPTVRDKR